MDPAEAAAFTAASIATFANVAAAAAAVVARSAVVKGEARVSVSALSITQKTPGLPPPPLTLPTYRARVSTSYRLE